MTPTTEGTPWLDRSEWSDGSARSEPHAELFAAWFGSVVWFGFSSILVMVVRREGLDSMHPAVLAGLGLFVSLTPLLLYGALRETARWRRFRALELVLDPFPGSVGGHVGGAVEIPIRRGAGIEARVTLTCIHSTLRKTSDGTSRSDSVVWTDDVVPRVEGAGVNSALRFTFEIPPDLPTTADEESGDYHYWAVRVHAVLAGADLDRTFRVPVYALDPPTLAADPVEPEAGDPMDLPGWGISAHRVRGTLELLFRPGREGFAAPMVFLAGLVLLGGGIFAFRTTWEVGDFGFGLIFLVVGAVFLLVFGLVGGLLTLAGAFMMVNGLRVEIGAGRIRSTRSILLLLRRTREVRIDELESITVGKSGQKGQGGRLRVTYRIRGVLRGGGHVALGDGIRDTHRMERICTLLEDATGLEAVPEPKKSLKSPRKEMSSP